MRKLRQARLAVAMAALGFATFSQAHSMPGEYRAGTGIEEQPLVIAVPLDGISLDEAVRRAEAKYGCCVVRTEVQDEDGRKVYLLKLLSENGRVITVRIDAATGKIR